MKKRIVCFGDSNTWGFRAIEGTRYAEDVRWTGRLQAMLGDDYTVIEEGLNGRTTVWDDPVENHLAGITYLWPCMESHSPFDLLIVMLGTNDAKYRFGEKARGIAEGAGRLVEMAQKCSFGHDGQPPKVLLVSPIRIEQNAVFDYLFGIEGEEKSREFASEYKAIAERLGCYFMDAAKIADPCKEDGLHLNAEGHEKLAQAMFETVQRILV